MDAAVMPVVRRQRRPSSASRSAQSFCVRSKTKGEVRLDDNETRISGARRADVTGVGAWVPSCPGFGVAKIRRMRQLHPRQGCHPVDVGSKSRVAGEKGS